MRVNITTAVRGFVRERAGEVCEYCHFPESESYNSYHVEHIISLKHLGTSEPDNLAHACPLCNMAKGSDISTLVGKSKKLTRLFHPRRDNWDDHFEWDGVLLVGKSEVGEATIQLLRINDVDRLIERQEL